MKIAFFLSSKNIVPPLKTGGIEQPCYYLIEELIKRGNEITLFAAPGSKIKGVKIKNISPFPTSVNLQYANMQERITSFYDLTALAEFFYSGEANKFDIIQFNNYIFYEILPFAKMSKTPIIIQINYPHNEIYPFIKNKLKQFKNVFYLPVSKFIKSAMPGLPYLEPVFLAHNLKYFECSDKPGEYLFFIGRMCPEKGPDLAIKVAKKINQKLVIAGGVGESYKNYFNNSIRPFIDNNKIIYVGEVDFKTKIKIYKKATATLFPIQWDEPSGGVLMESMACGTPVIAFDRASVREFIKDKVSGYIVRDGDVTAMSEAVHKIGKIDRRKVRRFVETNFFIEKEADKYEKICQKIIKDNAKKANINR